MQNETVGFFNGRSIIERSVRDNQNKSAWINTLYQKIYGNKDPRQIEDDKFDSMKAFKDISLRMGKHFRNNEDIQALLNNNLYIENSAQFLDNGDFMEDTTLTNRHKRSFTNTQLPSLILSPSMMRDDSNIMGLTAIRKTDDTMMSPEFFTTRPSYILYNDDILSSTTNLNPFTNAITADEIKVIDDDPTVKELAAKNQQFGRFNKRVLKLKNHAGLSIEENKTQVFANFNKKASQKLATARAQVENLTKISKTLQDKIRNYHVPENIPMKRPTNRNSLLNMMEYMKARVSVRTNETENVSLPQTLETVPEIISTPVIDEKPEPAFQTEPTTAHKTPELRPIPEAPSPIEQLEINEVDIRSTKSGNVTPTRSRLERVNNAVKKHFLTPKPQRPPPKIEKKVSTLESSKSEITIIPNLQSVSKNLEQPPVTFRPDVEDKTLKKNKSERTFKKPVLRMDSDIFNTETGQIQSNRIRKVFLPKLPSVKTGSKDQEEFRKIYIKCTNIHENLHNMDKKLFKQTSDLTSTYDNLSDKLVKIKRTIFLPQNIVLDGI